VFPRHGKSRKRADIHSPQEWRSIRFTLDILSPCILHPLLGYIRLVGRLFRVRSMAILPAIFPALPKYDGPYAVGSVEVEVPLKESRDFEVLDTRAETILMRLFYPAEDTCAGTSPSWLPQPTREYIKGYADFLNTSRFAISLFLSLAMYNTTIPVSEGAEPISLNGNTRFPVMIFSHGLGGSRNGYSQWCGSIASHGVCVAAIEHRDGSAPISVVKGGTDDQYEIPYRRITEWNEQSATYRTAQLAQRVFEVSKLITVLRDINHGNVVGLNDKQREAMDLLKGHLHTKKGQFLIAGHSFGAATSVAACKDTENIENDYPLKDEFRGAIMLDIWMMVLLRTAQLI
jgi:platelet-activating factor acetylhydrolase